jgi:hypothetical protein
MEPQSESEWTRAALDDFGQFPGRVDPAPPGEPVEAQELSPEIEPGPLGEPGPLAGPGSPAGSGDWVVSLDAPIDQPGARPVSLGRWLVATLLIAVLAASTMIWGPDTGEDPPPVAAVLGRHLAVPIALPLPANAVATADGSYVGIQFPAGGVVLLTVPTQVVEPSGARTAIPADPADWLARHPSVFVSRVQQVLVGGTRATQIDYRRSRMATPASRFAGLSLFCGWRTETEPAAIDLPPAVPDSARTGSRVCTQITSAARVRATFVPMGGRTLLVEAVWQVSTDPASSSSPASTGTAQPATDPAATGPVATAGTSPNLASNRMPRALQRSYAALLAGLAPVRGTPARLG